MQSLFGNHYIDCLPARRYCWFRKLERVAWYPAASNILPIFVYESNIFMLLTTVYAVTEGNFNVVSNWENRSGLAINPTKTEIVLFTRWYKILDIPLPSFGGSCLQPIDEVKYLGLILGRNLSWRTIAVEEI